MQQWLLVMGALIGAQGLCGCGQSTSAGDTFTEASRIDTFDWSDCVAAGTCGSLTDTRAGAANRAYKWVTIGTQVWMAENLDFGDYAIAFIIGGGDQPNSVKAQANATSTLAQKYCYDNIEANCATQGGLYQWHTAMGLPGNCDVEVATSSCVVNTKHQGICPVGWHVPTQADWLALRAFVDAGNGGVPGVGLSGEVTGDEGPDLKAASGWSCNKEISDYYTNAPAGGTWCGDGVPKAADNGTNSSGFKGLPTGMYLPSTFQNVDAMGQFTRFWTATETDAYRVWHYRLYSNVNYLEEVGGNKGGFAYTVRCLRD